MNLRRIDAAIASYGTKLGADGQARLAFFRGIWEIQQAAQERVHAVGSYQVSDADDLDVWYWDGTTSIFAQAPVRIDADLLVQTAREIAAYLTEHADLTPDDATALQAFAWEQLAGPQGAGEAEDADGTAQAGEAGSPTPAGDSAADAGGVEDPAGAPVLDCAPNPQLAGSDPADYLALVARWLEAGEVPGADLVVMALSLALRALLEPAQTAAMAAEHKAALAGYTTHAKPLRCPCCGGEPTLAYVGPTEASSGNGRILYCGQCGATWEVERVRCPHCGSRSQDKLHYVSVEGDEAHRIYACEECGRYTRTFFAPDATAGPSGSNTSAREALGLGAAFVPEVEDVVMATLDAVAQSDSYAQALAQAQAER